MQILYQISSGVAPFTAHITPQVAADQVHNTLGTFSFDDLPDNLYELSVTDAENCNVLLYSGETTTTTTTTTTLPEYKELSVIGGETYGYVGDSTNVNVEFDTDLALLFINTYDPATRAYSIPNIGGIDMTEIGTNAGVNRVEVWYLFDPPKLATTVNISGAGTTGTVEFTLMYITTTGLTLYSYDILHQSGSGTSISQTISKPINSFNLCLFDFVLLSALVFPELVEGVAEDSNGTFYPTIGTCFRAAVNGTYENACISFRTDNDIDNTSNAVLAFTNAFNWQSLAVSLYAI